MTVEGYKALDEELKRLKTLERPAVIAAIAEARAHGDLSENAEYHAAKERQGWIEGQIADIEDRMARAQVIDVSKLSGNQIKFGATVSVVDEDPRKSPLPDRRRARGRREAGPRLHHLAHRARDDRQGERRRRRGHHAGRREGLRDHQGGVGLDPLLMDAADKPLLNIWAVSDGRAGIEAQAVGLADAVARLRPAQVTIKRIAWKAPFGRLPWGLIPPRLALEPDSGMAPPWPDIWIAAGRATLPLSTACWLGAAARPLWSRPRTARAAGPLRPGHPTQHDGLSGPTSARSWARQTASRPRSWPSSWRGSRPPSRRCSSRVAVIIGGRSKPTACPFATPGRQPKRSPRP